MSRLHPSRLTSRRVVTDEPRRGPIRHAPSRSCRWRRREDERAFTLVELLIAMTITALLSVVLGGLVAAVHAAWSHTRGLEETEAQARVAFQRIQYMISHAGTYEIEGQPTRLGVAVVPHVWAFVELPDVLVVWSGGREGGMAAAGVQERLPRTDELVIYAADPDDASHLVEITVPDATAEIDFDATDFAETVRRLVDSSESERVLISDRIRKTPLPGFSQYEAEEVGNIRFELTQTPSDDELADVSPETEEWSALTWCQGIVAGDSGMRQVRLRMELQLDTNKSETTSNTTSNTTSTTAIPFFGSASYRYAYHP